MVLLPHGANHLSGLTTQLGREVHNGVLKSLPGRAAARNCVFACVLQATLDRRY